MRKNDAFVAKFVNRRLTKIFMATFAPDEKREKNWSDFEYAKPYTIYLRSPQISPKSLKNIPTSPQNVPKSPPEHPQINPKCPRITTHMMGWLRTL